MSSRSGNFDLYVMDADGTNVTRLTDHPANDYDPIWMPDGQSLIFSSERDSRERSVSRVARRIAASIG